MMENIDMADIKNLSLAITREEKFPLQAFATGSFTDWSTITSRPFTIRLLFTTHGRVELEKVCSAPLNELKHF